MAQFDVLGRCLAAGPLLLALAAFQASAQSGEGMRERSPQLYDVMAGRTFFCIDGHGPFMSRYDADGAMQLASAPDATRAWNDEGTWEIAGEGVVVRSWKGKTEEFDANWNGLTLRLAGHGEAIFCFPRS